MKFLAHASASSMARSRGRTEQDALLYLAGNLLRALMPIGEQSLARGPGTELPARTNSAANVAPLFQASLNLARLEFSATRTSLERRGYADVTW